MKKNPRCLDDWPRWLTDNSFFCKLYGSGYSDGYDNGYADGGVGDEREFTPVPNETVN